MDLYAECPRSSELAVQGVGKAGLGLGAWLAQHPSGVLCLLKLLAEMPDAEVRTV